MLHILLPTALTIASTIVFFTLERVFPGRELPNSKGWYGRAVLITLCQIGVTLITNKLWVKLFDKTSIFDISLLNAPVLEGLIGWLTGTFFFYWWHRLRHMDGFWLVFHQVHHSPKRIEVLTSFYKHPIEIFMDSLVSGFVMYILLGASMEGAFWFNFFAATGEYFYHANLKSPKWLRHFIQTPELHSIHHELDVHKYNYSDLPIWDKLFGTYKDTEIFAGQCGFPNNNEKKLWKMIKWKDVYDDAE